ncbi:SDR family NAD(P)-dependent oxidoreductase [Methylobacterium platani]|uniref:Acetoin dehydrogenase n=2 Tax=Methylobacterium platani TaxID=427683 RepID=A0A179S2N0_9HYPH|nr:SDR family NAD(P)-dependent oxidoreductase [Methylobacterium platani]KMO12742.1 acetoin dehydrogenase [Methylobacterium platani JCM 14648]OAS17267.1 acetoin dehydrogenase [Methylobacterium platani]
MADAFPLQDKLALVTGAGGGIGAALSAGLARSGARLVLIDRDAEGLARSEAVVRALGREVSAHILDLAEADAIAALPAAVAARHGPLDLLVNNAGVALAGRFADVELADFDWLMDVNFRAVVRMTHAFLPVLEGRPAAQIVNLSSLYGIVAPPGQTAYAASKFAVRGFSEALRHEYAGTNLGVSVVHPGGVATSIARSARAGPRLDPAEVARGKDAAERFLRLSPEAAAARILRGIARREPRIVVGRDAAQVALIQRLMPVRYWSLLARAMERTA